MSHEFGKQERLKSRKLIEQLFQGSRSAKGFPVMAVYRPSENEQALNQVGFSVAKRRLKLAVDRNKVKRRMLESYRQNKSILANSSVPALNIMFIYLNRGKSDYELIEKGMIKVLEKIVASFSEKADND